MLQFLNPVKFKSNQTMALLFISSLVPDTKRYHNEAFTRSGNNVLTGIASSLSLQSKPSYWSFRPVPSFPNGPIWISGENVELAGGEKVRIFPTLNLKLIKNIFWNILAALYILKWTFKYRHENRDILVYNIYIPSISGLYRISKLTKSKLFAIIYDLGIPPKRLGLGKLTMLGYRIGERKAKRYLPKIDGRIVINENIISHYAPGKDFILVDGGINDDVIANLPPMQISQTSSFTFVLAGMLWDQNGTKLVIDTLKKHPDLNIKVIFAGRGKDVPRIKEAAHLDKRIEYAGMLSMEDLFRLYALADVLLNLRIEETLDFHFPSKLLEYMATGRYVISTPVAHAERDYGDYITILNDISVDGLYKAFSEIILNGKEVLYKKGQKARDFMLNNRNWFVQTKRIEDYIRSKH